MSKNIKISVKVDEHTIYEFSGKINEQIMIKCANEIEVSLIKNNVEKDKIQNVFELFIETIQNILSYAYDSKKLEVDAHEASCQFLLHYVSSSETYILESYNFIDLKSREVIEEKVNFLKELDDASLRKLIRQKGRSKEDSHKDGAGLGYIMMTRKSSSPMEIRFIPYDPNILIYKQKLFI